jgi:glutamate racemase
MIGIFDSGIGGLTVVKEFFKYLPKYQIVYFGDTAHLPYGTKSPNFIKKRSKEVVEFLLKKGCKAIVIACHTSSSIANDFLKKEFGAFPIFEIITPGIKKAVKLTKNKKIGIIGSPGTIKSGVYRKKLLSIDPSLKIYSQPCPLFVPLVEEGWIGKKETGEIAKDYILPLKKKGVDTLILGCTHYPLLKKTILKITGKDIKIVNPAKDFLMEFKKFLANNEKIESRLKKGRNHKFFVSDEPYNFKILSKLCLGKEINSKIVRF